MKPGDLVRICKPGYGCHGRLGMIISPGTGTGGITVAIPYPMNKLKVDVYDRWQVERVSGT